jgi:hypothetical protein
VRVDLASMLAALVAAFLGSWFGAYTALARFKRERAFDRQIDWYERMTRSLREMAERIEIALTFQDEGGHDASYLTRLWREVQVAHLALDRCAQEAALYASEMAIRTAESIADCVQDVADTTDAFDPRAGPIELGVRKLAQIRALPEKLYLSAKPLAVEARRHLGIAK